jgi:hypothetical protein
MTVKIAMMLALAAAFVFTLIYFKRKKDLEQSTHLKDIKIQTTEKVEPAKVDVIKPAAVSKVTPPSAVVEAESDSGTLGETILKRHHLSQIRQMVMATTFPQPTDSMLSRHYDEMIDAKAEDCLADEVKMARLIADYDAYLNTELTAKKSPVVAVENTSEISDAEEEPMLKRHHLHHVRVMLAATTFPRPTDSALSRHYDEMIDTKAEDCLNDEVKMARLMADYAASQNNQAVEENSVLESTSHQAMVTESQMAIPEDSMLRRHYLTHLQTNLEKN